MKRLAYEVILAGPADRDFIQIMDWSAEQFGSAAADRYETLIGRALTDVGEDPFRPGARQRPELPEGIYTYHLAITQPLLTSRSEMSHGSTSAPSRPGCQPEADICSRNAPSWWSGTHSSQ